MQVHPIDHVVDGLARRQHGAFGLHQLQRAGADDSLIRRRVADGRWRRLDRRVFCLPGHPGTWHQRAMAATLVVPGAVVSGRSAGVLWGLLGLRPGSIEITIPRSRRVSTTLAQVRRSDVVETRWRAGIPVQSLPLTLLALASQGRDGFDDIVEQAIIDGTTDLRRLRDVHIRLAARGVPGCAALRRFLEGRADDEPISESELERRMVAVATHPEIPRVEVQASFPWRPSAPQRVDGLIRPWRTILEGDGRQWHARLEAMDADRRRDREALANGHLPLRFGYGELVSEPDACRRTIVAAGRDHGARLAR